MKQVVIGFDKKGNPYVVSGPKKIEVVIRKPKRRSLTKRIKTLWWKLRNLSA